MRHAALAYADWTPNCRGVTRVRVADTAIRGTWAYGLVLRSTHLVELETLNIVGEGAARGCAVAVLMDGAGAPTGHTFENLRIYFFGTGMLQALLAFALATQLAGFMCSYVHILR